MISQADLLFEQLGYEKKMMGMEQGAIVYTHPRSTIKIYYDNVMVMSHYGEYSVELHRAIGMKLNELGAIK